MFLQKLAENPPQATGTLPPTQPAAPPPFWRSMAEDVGEAIGGAEGRKHVQDNADVYDRATPFVAGTAASALWNLSRNAFGGNSGGKSNGGNLWNWLAPIGLVAGGMHLYNAYNDSDVGKANSAIQEGQKEGFGYGAEQFKTFDASNQELAKLQHVARTRNMPATKVWFMSNGMNLSDDSIGGKIGNFFTGWQNSRKYGKSSFPEADKLLLNLPADLKMPKNVNEGLKIAQRFANNPEQLRATMFYINNGKLFDKVRKDPSLTNLETLNSAYKKYNYTFGSAPAPATSPAPANTAAANPAKK